MKLKFLIRCASLFIATTLPFAAKANDGQQIGKIAYLSMFSGAAPRVLISLEGFPSMCGTGTSVVTSILAADSNYQELLASLLTAYSTGRKVQVFTTNLSGACHIDSITLLPD